MNIEWNHSQCVVCLGRDELTKEHIIPGSVGGILTSHFLCRRCNSDFGKGFEAAARLAPDIRKAAEEGLGESRHELSLKDKLELGAQYESRFDGHIAKGNLRSDGHIGTSKLEDGSIIFPDSDVAKRIRSIMRSHGVADPAEAVSKWIAAPPKCEVDLGQGVTIKKFPDHPSTPVYNEPPLSSLVPLKTAYEFAAVLLGSAIYNDAFAPIRRILLKQDQRMADEMVTYKWANMPDAFHGIAFEGNQQIAQFQVRFFGRLAYTVRLPSIAINHSPVVYTQQLDAGRESWAIQPD